MRGYKKVSEVSIIAAIAIIESSDTFLSVVF